MTSDILFLQKRDALSCESSVWYSMSVRTQSRMPISPLMRFAAVTMASLMGGGDKIPQIVEDLRGVIFKDPLTGPFDIDGDAISWYKGWQTADEAFPQ